MHILPSGLEVLLRHNCRVPFRAFFGERERGFFDCKDPSRIFKPFYYVFRADVWVLLKKYVEIIAIHLIFGGVCV